MVRCIPSRVVELSSSSIQDAARLVKSGGVIVYPTDTVYGIGCDPFDKDALRRLTDAKGERKKPLPILASSISDLKELVDLSGPGMILAEGFWPGPLTIVARRIRDISDLVTQGSEGLGVRVPDHPMVRELIWLCGGLIVGTSANLTGQKAATTISEVGESILSRVDLALDGGETKYGVESTVVSVMSGEPKTLRPGAIDPSLVTEALEARSQAR